MGRQRLVLALIAALVAGALLIIWKLPPRLGLDLQGGSQLTIQVKPTAERPIITPDDLKDVTRVIERRVNESGVSETIVQPASNNQVLVQLPGVKDPQEAERQLKGTAQLDFREQKQGTEQQYLIERQQLAEKYAQRDLLEKAGDEAGLAKNREELLAVNQSIATLFVKTELTGKNLKNAYPSPAQQGSNVWDVALEFDKRGGELFAELTKRIAGTGRTLGIFLDDAPISDSFAYTVDVKYAQTGIAGGNAVIEGRFTAEEARDIAVQLRGGALPFPVEVVENRTVGATLGRDSIQRSIVAGLAGLALVLVFMVWYYRLPGLIADIALIIYAILTLAVFCLLQVTLTLPGIAGFILSIGMAVDANVLIFERTREELRAGKTLYRSVEAGFYRAFSSILDSNVTTLIACAALAGFSAWLANQLNSIVNVFGLSLPPELLGDSPAIIQGFAVTLACGVLVSMFSAITCSRTLMLYVLTFPSLRKPEYFCPNLQSTRSQPTQSEA
jgi:preprotein translocase subunit SecD